MKRFFFLLFCLFAGPAWADMFQDGSNAKLPTTGTPVASVCTTASGSLAALAAGCTPGVVSPMQFGAVGNCTANDDAAVHAALTAAMPNKTLLIDRCYLIKTTLSVTSPVQILGNNPQPYAGWPASVGGFAACPTGIRVDTVNLSAAIAFSAGASGAEMRGVCIDNRNVANTSGATVTAVATSGTFLNGIRLVNNQMIGCFICIDISGTGASTQNIGSYIEGSTFFPQDVPGAIGIRIGHYDAGGNNNAITTQLHFNKIDIYCNGAISTNTTAIRIEDGGGVYMRDVNTVACNYGLVVQPGANQSVTGGVVSDSSFDSDDKADLLIDIGASTGMVGLLQFDNTWFSASKGQPVLIQNTGGGTMAGIHFTASRFYPRQNTDIVGIKNISGSLGNISFRDSVFCWTGTVASNGTGINIANTVTVGGAIDITGNTIGACDPNGTIGTLATGITLASSTIAVNITGNRLIQNIIPINLAGTTNLLVANNAGIDDQPALNVTSTAPTTTIPISQPISIMQGTAAIQNILPAWNGRKLTIINAGNWTTVAGGNINSGYPGPAGKSLTSCVFSSPSWQCQ